jgi:hypothetical protein
VQNVSLKQAWIVRAPPDLVTTIRQHLVLLSTQRHHPRRVLLNQHYLPGRALLGKHNADGQPAGRVVDLGLKVLHPSGEAVLDRPLDVELLTVATIHGFTQ